MSPLVRGKKLGVLLKTYEAAEITALQTRKSIDKVVDERRLVLEKLKHRRDEIAARVKGFSGKKRLDAVQAGNVVNVLSMTSYAKRLQKELDKLLSIVKEKEEELNRAELRAGLAEAELVDARVEKRKLEQLIEAQQKIANRNSIAQSEAEVDEMNTFRRKYDK